MADPANVAIPSEAAATADGRPPCLIVLGMAGSGKSSFVQRLASHLHAKRVFPYLVNLDPAAATVPFPANIDIRDTVNYKSVMQEYGLGPNGAILTCLNLFCTRFNQVLDLLDKRRSSIPYAVFDTPGQIEVFTWSASGTIITDSLATDYPTVIAYVMDSARSTNPTTFMSNMLYACSILYRTKLPFFVVLNKSDVVEPTFAVEWMRDFEKFQTALDESSSSFMNDLTRSLSLVLDSFYEDLNWVSVSAKTGDGFDEVLTLVEKCRLEYWAVYRPMCEQMARERAAAAESENTAGDSGTLPASATAEKLAKLEIRENVATVGGERTDRDTNGTVVADGQTAEEEEGRTVDGTKGAGAISPEAATTAADGTAGQ